MTLRLDLPESSRLVDGEVLLVVRVEKEVDVLFGQLQSPIDQFLDSILVRHELHDLRVVPSQVAIHLLRLFFVLGDRHLFAVHVGS